MHLVEIVDSFLTDPKAPCRLSSKVFESVRRFAQTVEDTGEGHVTMVIYDAEAEAVSFERIDSDLRTFVVNFYDGTIEFMDDKMLDRVDNGDYDETVSIEYDEALKLFLNQGD